MLRRCYGWEEIRQPRESGGVSSDCRPGRVADDRGGRGDDDQVIADATMIVGTRDWWKPAPPLPASRVRLARVDG